MTCLEKMDEEVIAFCGFLVLVHGKTKGWVKASRGSMLDGRFSPFLFTMVVDTLSRQVEIMPFRVL